MPAAAPVPAATEQPQTGERRPRLRLTKLVARWLTAIAFAISRRLLPVRRPSTAIGIIAVMPWLPLPALLMPAVWNAVLVGWELTYYIGEIPFWLNAVYVAAGEAAVLLVLGTALYFALGSRRLQERLFPQGV